MNELINAITTKVGLNEEQATKAIHLVVSFLAEKLPAPLATQLQAVAGLGASDAPEQALAGSGASTMAEQMEGIGAKFGF